MPYSRRTLRLVFTVALVLVLSVSLLPLGGAIMGADGQPAGPTGIAGIVTQEDGTTPITGAQIRVEDYSTGTPVAGSPFSNYADGTYFVGGLTAGTYRVRASAAGYVSEWWNNVVDKPSATAVTVVSGAITDNIDFALAPGGSIAGIVRNNWGGPAPLSNAAVEVKPSSGTGAVYSTTTDGSGNYSIGGLPYGDYKVSAVGGTAGGGDTTKWAKQFYNLKDGWDAADVVTVSAGTPNRTGINFNLVPGAGIEGNIRDQNNNAVAGATVSAEGFTSRQLATQATTDASGHYRLEGLAAGDYRIYATAPNRVLKYHNDTYEGTFEWWSATSVHVNAGDWRWIGDLKLESAGTVSGTVKQADGVTPIPGARVNANTFDTGQFMASTTSNADGTYTIPGVPAGVAAGFRISASAPDYAREFWNNVVDPASATPVGVFAGVDTPSINFTLDPGGTMAGTVTSSTGTALFNVLVVAQPTGGAAYVFTGRTNSQGEYTIQGLPFGSYTVSASIEKYLPQWYNQKADVASADPVSIAAGTPNATAIDFALILGGSIQGSVKQKEDNNPIGSAIIRLFQPGTFELITVMRAQPDGSYKIWGLATGDYLVQASADEWAWRIPAWWQNNVLGRDQATAVHVTAPNNTTGINFLLESGGRIHGVVRDANPPNTPLEGALVNIQGTTTDSRNLEFNRNTGTDGGYDVWLPFGDYTVMAEGAGAHAWYRPQWFNHQQSEAEADIIQVRDFQRDWWAEFHLNESGVITGQLLEADGTTPIEGATVTAWDFYNWDESQDWNKRGEAITRQDGSYSLFASAGDVRVKATAPGHVRKYYDNTFDQNTASKVSVIVGAEVPDVDFILEGGGSISGTVADGQTGLPIWDATVTAQPSTGPRPDAQFVTHSAQDGTYVLDNIPFGSYNLMAQGNQPTPPRYAVEWYQEKTDLSQADVVTLDSANANPAGINFTLELGGSITGHVYSALQDGSQGNPEWGVWITVRNAASGQVVGKTQTQGDGSYFVDSLATGNYQLTAGRWNLNREFYDNKPDWQSADLVTVTAPSETPNIDFILDQANGTISGTVAYTGTAVPNPQMSQIRVKALDLRVGGAGGMEQAQDAQPNQSGYYEMHGVGTGPYLVFAYLDAAEPMGWPNTGDPYGFYGDPTVVYIGKTPTWTWATGIDVNIDDTTKGLLSGVARLQLGSVHDSIAVAAAGVLAQTDDNGLFMAVVAPGTHDVTFSMTGYLPVTVPDVMVGEFFSGAPGYIPGVLLLAGDLDNSGTVDMIDLSMVAIHFNTPLPMGDLNGDGIVNIFDLAMVANNFGKTQGVVVDGWDT